MHERADQILERFLVEEVEQHNVRTVVSRGKVVDGPRARAAERRAKEVRQVRLVFVDRLLGEQIDSSVEVDLLVGKSPQLSGVSG